MFIVNLGAIYISKLILNDSIDDPMTFKSFVICALVLVSYLMACVVEFAHDSAKGKSEND